MSRSFENPDIYNYMDISTGHITSEDRDRLDVDAELTVGRNGAQAFIVFKYPEGWFVHIPPDADPTTDLELPANTYSDQVLKILEKASECDCCFVRFDADGLKYEDLEEFPWS